MPQRDIVVLGGSSGALEALGAILGALPADLSASLFVVVHTSADNPGVLPRILQRRTAMQVTLARDGMTIERGQIHVPPPDHHLRLADGRVALDRGPRENGFRPAVDPLFLSAAQEYGERVIGVVLSGGLDDGTLGLLRIKRAGGVALVQTPEEAVVTNMPRSAIEHVEVDLVLPAAEIGAALVGLVRDPQPARRAARTTMTKNDSRRRPRGAPAAGSEIDVPAPPDLPQSCPDCGGALSRFAERDLERYRCHVGHVYTELGLLDGRESEVEGALWSAIRALREQAALRRRMALRAHDRGWATVAGSYEVESRDSERRAEVLHDLLASAPPAHVIPEPGAATEELRAATEPARRAPSQKREKQAAENGRKRPRRR